MRPVPCFSLLLLLTAASTAHAQVTLSPRYPEGMTNRRFNLLTRQTLTIAGQDVPTASEVTVDFRSDVGKPEADGTLRSQESLQRIRLKLSLPGDVNVEFDSDGPEVKSGVPEIQNALDGLRAVKGQGYTLVLGKNHRVTAVEGLEKLIAAAPEASREALRASLNAEKVKREANQNLDALPVAPVKKGDRWQRTQQLDIGSGQTLTFENFYEYDGTVEKDGRTLDRINVFAGSVKYDLDPDAPLPVKVTKSDLQVASSAGTILFDRERGQIVENRLSSRIQGPMTFSVNGMDLPGSLDLTLEMNTALVK